MKDMKFEQLSKTQLKKINGGSVKALVHKWLGIKDYNK